MSLPGRLLISCPDQPGIVAKVAQFLFNSGANITHSDQHTTAISGGTFFMRIEFVMDDLPSRMASLESEFAKLGEPLGINSQFVDASRRKRLTVFVTKEDHCLLELIWQIQSGDLAADLVQVIANHDTLQPICTSYGVPFHIIPISSDTKSEAEAAAQQLVSGSDFLVLARYMQVLSPNFLERWPHRVINIHHSFLPAFAGANPYKRAFERGVKLIGATAHYVTEELDEGPIINQDVEPVDHRQGVAELRRIGRHIERTVLAKAVKWHVEDRVIVHENRTIVFS
jgi:formyltetrahydrofolate deformylase